MASRQQALASLIRLQVLGVSDMEIKNMTQLSSMSKGTHTQLSNWVPLLFSLYQDWLKSEINKRIPGVKSISSSAATSTTTKD
jgi:hypothetical protein